MNYLKAMAKASSALSALIFILSILPVQTSAADEINIKIYEKTEIEKEEILLGEVGDVNGNDRDLVNQIEKIVIGNVPLPGEKKKIDRDLICIRLKQSDIDPTKINIIVPDNAVATRKTIDITSADIEKIVLNFVHNTLQLADNKLNITNVRIDNKVTLAKGDISCKVISPKNKELLGTTLLSLEFSVNGRFQKKVWVTVDIEVFAKVVVTKRPLGRYKLITEDDIHLVDMNLAKLPSSVIMSCKDVLGKRARRAIDTNVILKPDLIELPPLVKTGDIVLIIAESDGMKVTTLGKVKESGSKGQMVKVENIDSTKGIYGRVMDSNSVKVDY